MDLSWVPESWWRLVTGQSKRDPAPLRVIGFPTGLRRSELAALELSDLRFIERRGLEITVRRSKADQAGQGRKIGVARGWGDLDALAAMQAWLKLRGREAGSLFGVTDRRILKVLKAGIAAIGLDPGEYGAHPLRAGMITMPPASPPSDHAAVGTQKRGAAGEIRPDPLAR